MMQPKFRASSVANLMTEPKSKADKDAGLLSEGAKTHAIDVWVSAKYNRYEEVYSKYFEKGNEVEEASITFLSIAKRKLFRKNEVRLENDWIMGTPDLFLGDEIVRATEIIDIKSAWDIFTFNRTKAKGVNSNYYWQMQSYMSLTGATKATLAYCLVNATADLITDEKYRIARAHRVTIDDMDADFVKSCQLVERNMIYDMDAFTAKNPNFNLHTNLADWNYDVPPTERLYEVEIQRNDEDIAKISQKVEAAWNFLRTWCNFDAA
jgi:hypothetical protein